MPSRHNPLTPSPSNLSHTLTNTHTHQQHISLHRHFPHSVQAGSGNPTAQKTTLNTSLADSYRPVSLLPFIAKTLEWVVFNQVSLFLSHNNQLDANQSGFRSGHSTETALLSVTEPCELQKLIPNHQSSFCWIYLPLLTLSIIRSSCPPSHHWASQGFLFAGLIPISPVGPSGWPGEGRYPKHIKWSLGFLRDRFLDPSSSPYTLHHWVPSYRHMASPTIARLMTHSSIFHFNLMIQR